MTADDFTEAARAEAERRHYPRYGQAVIIEVITANAFADGAEWARDHLAAQAIDAALRGSSDSDATPMSAEADVRYRPVRVDPPLPGDRRPNYVVDPEAIDAVARAWADAGPVPRVHRAAQKELRQSFPLLAQALDRLTGERPR